MPTSALLFALGAAVVHAAWNVLLAGARDTRAATAVAVVVGAVAFSPVAVLDWRVEPEALPWIAASAALETAYMALLAAAYARAPVEAVYPIARGSAPVIVLVAAAVLAGQHVGLQASAGVLLVAAGVVVGRRARGAPVAPSALALGLAIGTCIAGYTLVDQQGLRHASAVAYLELVLVLAAAAFVAPALRAGGPRALRTALGWRTVAAGVGFFGAYVLALLALARADAAPVAAVRESSVVLVVLLAAAAARRPPAAATLAGALAVAAGVGLIALS